MLRRDGFYTIYMLQHRVSAKDEIYAHSNMDVFGYPEGFSASGNCWQQTGIHGVFSPGLAERGLKTISEKNPTYTFRIVTVVISQVTLEGLAKETK